MCVCGRPERFPFASKQTRQRRDERLITTLSLCCHGDNVRSDKGWQPRTLPADSLVFSKATGVTGYFPLPHLLPPFLCWALLNRRWNGRALTTMPLNCWRTTQLSPCHCSFILTRRKLRLKVLRKMCFLSCPFRAFRRRSTSSIAPTERTVLIHTTLN